MSRMIIQAARTGDLDTVLEYEANVNDVNYEKRTALHWAAANGHVDVLCTLLDLGADPEARDMWWMTPLHLASMHGQTKAVQALLDRGACLKCQSKWGFRPIGVVCMLGNPSNKAEICKLLLRSREGVWGDEGEDEFYYAHMALAAAQKTRKATGPLALTLRSTSRVKGPGSGHSPKGQGNKSSSGGKTEAGHAAKKGAGSSAPMWR